jgi:hypothetical protein
MNSPKMLRPLNRVDDGSAAMTFEEIARRLGYRDPKTRGKKAVFMCYRNGMRKLQQRPRVLRKLLELSRMKQSIRSNGGCL